MSATVAQIVRLYLDHSRHFFAETTFYGRSRLLEAFARRFGERPVDECRRSDLELWLAENPQWSSDWTRRGNIAGVQRCFNWAVKDERIARNPFAGVTCREGEPRRAMRDQEFQDLLRAASPLFRRVLVFLRYTGCRPCEMAALEWPMLDLASGVFVLTKHKTSRTLKRPKPRVIRLVPQIVKLLAWLWKRRPAEETDPHVFVNARGTTWNRCNLSLRMQRIRDRADVAEDCKLYGTRHAFGTRAVVNGLDMKTLAELMGHSSSATTERFYVHLARENKHLDEAMRRATKKPA